MPLSLENGCNGSLEDGSKRFASPVNRRSKDMDGWGAGRGKNPGAGRSRGTILLQDPPPLERAPSTGGTKGKRGAQPATSGQSDQSGRSGRSGGRGGKRVSAVGDGADSDKGSDAETQQVQTSAKAVYAQISPQNLSLIYLSRRARSSPCPLAAATAPATAAARVRLSGLPFGKHAGAALPPPPLPPAILPGFLVVQPPPLPAWPRTPSAALRTQERRQRSDSEVGVRRPGSDDAGAHERICPLRNYAAPGVRRDQRGPRIRGPQAPFRTPTPLG